MPLILADNRLLRFFSFTVFYVAQGLPFGLVSVALPAFLAERGTEPGAIGGFIGLAMLPWSFKLLAGPLMDRFTYLAMGRRRPWVILAQLGLVVVGGSFMFFPEGLENLAILTTLCFLLNCFGATQDVAVDGMAIDVLPREEHGRANAFMAFGQVAGISASSAISAFALQSLGLPGVALMLFIGFGLILFWSIVVRERAGEKVLPWTAGEATQRSLSLKASGWKQIGVDLSKVLLLPASLLLMCVSFLFRFADGLWITVAPVVVVRELGYASTQYSSFTALSSFIAAVAGLGVGLFIDRQGVKTLYLLTLLVYGVLAVAVGFVEPLWSMPGFLIGLGFLQAFIYQGVFVSFIAIHMNLCWVKVAATQFALYMAWVNLARSLGNWSLAFLQDRFEYREMFFVIGVSFFVAVALLWKANLSAHAQKVRALEQADLA